MTIVANKGKERYR